jgi:hypothetical protein
MKNRLLYIPFIVLLISSSLMAQEKDFSHEIDQHNIFRQSNSLSNDYFDDHSYDNVYGKYRFIPESQSIRYNRVDGFFLGLGTDFTDPDSKVMSIGGLNFDGFLGYSTAQSDFQYKAGVSKMIGNSLVIGGEIIHSTTTDDYWRNGLTENSLTSLVAGYDYHDYYKAEGYGASLELNLSKVISIAGSYNYTKYSSLSNNTTYSLFEGGNIDRLNPAIDISSDLLTQNSFGFQLALNKKGYTRGNLTSKFILKGEISDAGFDNDFIYNKYEAILSNYIKLDRNTFFKVRTMIGSITGEAPDFKNFALGGIGSLRASGYKFYQGDKMILNNAELIFGDFWSFDKANLEMDGLYLSLFLDSGWTEFVDSYSKDPFDGLESFKLDGLVHNIGAGLGTSMIRLEIATPVSRSYGYTTFWLRFNPTF